MSEPTPQIDSRTAIEIAQQVRDLWEYDLRFDLDQAAKFDRVSLALINIFARFAEIIIRRLNQVLDRNFLAFLDLLGASRLPPQPARVPLTFTLAAGTTTDAVVPAGTQVTASAPEGSSNPVTFETEAELVVTSAQLTTLAVLDPEQDAYSVYDGILTDANFPIPVWRGDRLIERIFYIGHRQLLSFSQIERLSLTLEGDLLTGLTGIGFEWQTWNGQTWQQLNSLPPDNENTNTIDFAHLPAIPLHKINHIENRWLRCRLISPIAPSPQVQAGMVQSDELPILTKITINAVVQREDLTIAHAFTNQQSIDLSKDFFPFGERPRFGDTWYLSQDEALAIAGATITLNITLTNPADSPQSPIPPVKAANLKLQWEFWQGQAWQTIEVEDGTDGLTKNGTVKVTLPTETLPLATTINGVDSFWLRVRIVEGNYGQPATYKQTNQGDRIVPESFAPPSIRSLQVSYAFTGNGAPENVLSYNDFTYTNATNRFTPFQRRPDAVIHPTLYLGFTLPSSRKTFPHRPLTLYSHVANLRYGEQLIPLSPNLSRKFGIAGSTIEHEFIITNDTSSVSEWQIQLIGTKWRVELITPASLRLQGNTEARIQLRVEIPDNVQLNQRQRGFLQVINTNYPHLIHSATFETVVAIEPPDAAPPRLLWEYFNGQEWRSLTVRDQSNSFAYPGLIEFLPPADFAPSEELGLAPKYWLRVQWQGGNYTLEPRLQRLLFNTTMAAETKTFANEILGSSDGTANQKFYTTQTPILPGQQLDVQEPELPSIAETAALVVTNQSSRQVWIRWQEVPDFYNSQPSDRHYVLNRFTGEILFGNGRNGRIPPIGVGNIRMTRYQTGGGKAGNQPRNAITQLATTIAYVDRVTNLEPAAGGTAAETLEVLRERVPRQLRHRHRAVTLEDYEDLAKQAAFEVSRAKCVPLYDLVEIYNQFTSNPDLTFKDEFKAEFGRPGTLSLILIPQSDVPNPSPTLQLIDRVRDYLDRRRLPTTRLVVVGPYYIPVDVEVEIALTSLERANAVKSQVLQKLEQFLHPLTGGVDKTGWNFGRHPYPSDFYALLEAIPGVDHVRQLQVSQLPLANIQPQDNAPFLIYSGTHQINLHF